MSYTPTEWKTGDIITAEKMNKLENGVSAISPHFTDIMQRDTPPTGKDLKDLFNNGIIPVMRVSDSPDSPKNRLYIMIGYEETGMYGNYFDFLGFGGSASSALEMQRYHSSSDDSQLEYEESWIYAVRDDSAG